MENYWENKIHQSYFYYDFSLIKNLLNMSQHTRITEMINFICRPVTLAFLHVIFSYVLSIISKDISITLFLLAYHSAGINEKTRE